MSIYDARINYNGSTSSEHSKNTIKNYLNTLFADSISTYKVYIDNSDNTCLASIVNKSNSNLFSDVKSIVLQLDQQIKVGNLVRWNDENWICVKTIYNGVYYSGTIYKCNNELNWIDSFGQILNTPCYFINKNMYSVGLKEDTGLVLPDNKIVVIVPSNSETEKIERNNRFVFNHKYTYSITNIDSISSDGIIILTMLEELEGNLNDNLELNIANYYTEHDYEIIVENGSSLVLTPNSNLQLNVYMQDNGVKLKSQPQPKFNYTSNNNNVISVNEAGLITSHSTGSTNIVIEFNGTMKNINVTVANINSTNFSIVIEGNEYLRKGQTVEYFAKVINNGVEDSQLVTFENIDTDLVEIVETNNQSIKLKGLKSEGIFTFTAKLFNNTSIKSNKTIELKHLF